MLDAGTAMRWTGSWLTVFTTAQPAGPEAIPVQEHLQLIELLGRRRIAGYEVYTPDPRYAGLDLIVTVCAQPWALRGEVAAAVWRRARHRPPRRRQAGVLRPGHLTVRHAAGAQRPGSRDPARRRRRRRDSASQYRRRGYTPGFVPMPEVVTVARDEIIRVAGDPSWPDRGSVRDRRPGGQMTSAGRMRMPGRLPLPMRRRCPLGGRSATPAGCAGSPTGQVISAPSATRCCVISTAKPNWHLAADRGQRPRPASPGLVGLHRRHPDLLQRADRQRGLPRNRHPRDERPPAGRPARLPAAAGHRRHRTPRRDRLRPRPAHHPRRTRHRIQGRPGAGLPDLRDHHRHHLPPAHQRARPRAGQPRRRAPRRRSAQQRRARRRRAAGPPPADRPRRRARQGQPPPRSPPATGCC